MRISSVALCLALAATACIPDATKTEITNVRHDAQTGSVGGLVFDFVAGTPMAGVTVTLYTGKGPLTAMTDAQGFYAFPTVPVGAFSVIVTQTGYGPAVLTGTLNSVANGEAVNGPQTTLNPVGLITLNGTFDVRVVDEAGNPVNGAVLSATIGVQFVEWNAPGAVNGTGPQPRGSYVVTATSGTDGTAKFTGLPPFAKIRNIIEPTISVNVAPINITGSTIAYSFLGEMFEINVLDLSAQQNDIPTITLDSPDNALAIVKSSVEYLEGADNGKVARNKGAVGAIVTTGITIEFNNTLATDAKTITTIVQEVETNLNLKGSKINDRIKPSALTFSPTVNGNILTLMPSATPTAGATYWLTFSVQAAQKAGGVARVFSATFPFWGPLNTDVAVKDTQLERKGCNPTGTNAVNQTKVLQDVLTVTFNEPIGPGNVPGHNSAFYCVLYTAGAEFNGKVDLLTTGEIASDGTIICNTNDAGVSDGRTGTQMILQPLPNGIDKADTGYSAKWAFLLSDPTYYSAAPGVTVGTTTFVRPSNQKYVITFRFNGGADTIRRVDGTPVKDITITTPSTTPDLAPNPATLCSDNP